MNPVWQQLQTSVATSSGEVSGISAQRGELQRQRAEANARLHELQQATGTYDALQRKLAQTQADYTLYAQKRDEARISQALDREKMFDVALIERPTASQEPVKPKPLPLSGCGFCAGAAGRHGAGAVHGTPPPSRCIRPHSWMR